MAEGKRKGVGGPKTARGKAVVRLNPVRHGVLSQTPVIPLVERAEDWERLLAAGWDDAGGDGGPDRDACVAAVPGGAV